MLFYGKQKRSNSYKILQIIINDIEMQKNIDSVKRFIEDGNVFMIITGRSFTNIKKVFLLQKYF